MMNKFRKEDLPLWLLETMAMQDARNKPLTNIDIEMFLMFERECWSHENCMRHIISRNKEDLNSKASSDYLEANKVVKEGGESLEIDDFFKKIEEEYAREEKINQALYEKIKDSKGLIGGMKQKNFFKYLFLIERFRDDIYLEESFDPEQLGFVLLWDYQIDTLIKFYEWKNHDCVDGRLDMQRNNVYLSQSGDLIYIWDGYIDIDYIHFLAEENNIDSDDLNDEEIHFFRGYIQDEEHAKQILKAFHMPDAPQRLTIDSENGLNYEDV